MQKTRRACSCLHPVRSHVSVCPPRAVGSGSIPDTVKVIWLTPHYDPMIAKIIAWGSDREAARQRVAAALGQIEIEGLKSNRDFLIACLDHAEFRAGDVHTGFIDVHEPRRWQRHSFKSENGEHCRLSPLNG